MTNPCFAPFAALALAAMLGSSSAVAGEKVVYTFKGGSDGAGPEGALIADASGNLYGTTAYGGGCGDKGCGTVFELTPDGSETVLHAFTSSNDGAKPEGALLPDGTGNYYGTTGLGGSAYAGTVFKVAADGEERVFYSFQGGSDGENPTPNLVMDGDGNLYGATGGGGAGCGENGCGTLFKLSPDGTETVTYRFQGSTDGSFPTGVMIDTNGNLYGTTTEGGGTSCGGGGCGTVFKVTADGKHEVLYAFKSAIDGERPEAPVLMDSVGNLYGTTAYGGSSGGTVFEISPDRSKTVLHDFEGGTDGRYLAAGLIMDKAGNLIGATLEGGAGRFGAGTVFKVTPDGTETVVHAFGALAKGRKPYAALLDVKGTLYGTTSEGGACRSCGTVFAIGK